jgi:hypothetical protein
MQYVLKLWYILTGLFALMQIPAISREKENDSQERIIIPKAEISINGKYTRALNIMPSNL